MAKKLNLARLNKRDEEILESEMEKVNAGNSSQPQDTSLFNCLCMDGGMQLEGAYTPVTPPLKCTCGGALGGLFNYFGISYYGDDVCLP